MSGMEVGAHAGVSGPPRESTKALVRELVAHLRAHRGPLSYEWARRIRQAGLLRRMSKREVFAEADAAFEQYVDALETGTIRTLRAYARNLSERIIPRGVETGEVVGIVLLLRDVLARSLFGKYRTDSERLDRVLDAYEPAANRIATTVAVGFVEERDRIRDVNIALRRINERLEAEVRRIARALHDEAGPLLVAVHLALKETARDTPPAVQRQLAEVSERLNQVEDQLRHLSHELRPPMLDEAGLVPALRFLVDGVWARKGLGVVLDNRLETRLPSAVETAVYRVVQEGLSNVCRHGRATQAWVTVFVERGELHCIVRDDGKGMNESMRSSAGRRGLGLVGMRERLIALGGTLHVSSTTGRGTQLHARMPVEA